MNYSIKRFGETYNKVYKDSKEANESPNKKIASGELKYVRNHYKKTGERNILDSDDTSTNRARMKYYCGDRNKNKTNITTGNLFTGNNQGEYHGEKEVKQINENPKRRDRAILINRLNDYEDEIKRIDTSGAMKTYKEEYPLFKSSGVPLD